MKFTTPEIEFEKLQTLDIVSASLEEGTTVSPIDPSIKNDPYQNDKW